MLIFKSSSFWLILPFPVITFAHWSSGLQIFWPSDLHQWPSSKLLDLQRWNGTTFLIPYILINQPPNSVFYNKCLFVIYTFVHCLAEWVWFNLNLPPGLRSAWSLLDMLLIVVIAYLCYQARVFILQWQVKRAGQRQKNVSSIQYCYTRLRICQSKHLTEKWRIWWK